MQNNFGDTRQIKADHYVFEEQTTNQKFAR